MRATDPRNELIERESLRQLGWDHLVQAVNQRLRCRRSLPIELPLASTFQQAQISLEETRELSEALARGGMPDVQCATDAHATLQRIDQGDALSPVELDELKHALRLVFFVHDYLASNRDLFPVLYARWIGVKDFNVAWEQFATTSSQANNSDNAFLHERSSAHGWLRQNSTALHQLLHLLLHWDFKIACASLGRELGASFVELKRTTGFAFFNARNPLLLLRGEQAVPVTLLLHPGRAVVLSGAHAGGKTSTLQTLGLLAGMARAGLPLPCENENSFASMTSLIAVNGVAQSAQACNHDFLAWLSWLARLKALAKRDTLFVIDDVGVGTDAMLGASILTNAVETWCERGATTFIATHNTALKARAATHARMVNAAVGFDTESGIPTFQTSLGLPADSEWQYAARLAGWDERAIAEVERTRPSVEPKLQRLVRELERQGEMARRETLALEREQKAIEHARGELSQEHQAISEQRSRSNLSTSGVRQSPFQSTQHEELDVRGFSAEQAIGLVRMLLARLQSSGLEQARIVHGSGSGSLRSAVRQYLEEQTSTSIDIVAASPQDGGESVTVIRLARVIVPARR